MSRTVSALRFITTRASTTVRCALTVTAAWANLDTGASGSSDITAVSTLDAHYGFIGYANTTFETGSGTVVVTLSSHPGAELRITA